MENFIALLVLISIFILPYIFWKWFLSKRDSNNISIQISSILLSIITGVIIIFIIMYIISRHIQC